MSAYHAIDGSVDRTLRDDIHFDGAKIGLVVGREGLNRLHLRGIAACGGAHSGEDRMTRSRETLRGHESEAARSAGDDDDFVHVSSPWFSGIWSDHAAIDSKRLAIHPTRVRSDEKRDDIGHIFRLSQ